MVVKLFGEVENKNVPVPEFPEHPFQEEHLKVSECLISLQQSSLIIIIIIINFFNPHLLFLPSDFVTYYPPHTHLSDAATPSVSCFFLAAILQGGAH